MLFSITIKTHRNVINTCRINTAISSWIERLYSLMELICIPITEFLGAYPKSEGRETLGCWWGPRTVTHLIVGTHCITVGTWNPRPVKLQVWPKTCYRTWDLEPFSGRIQDPKHSYLPGTQGQWFKWTFYLSNGFEWSTITL